LILIVLGWELPEDFLETLGQYWITEYEDVLGHEEDVQEVQGKGPHLLSIDADTQHVTQHEVVSECSEIEEKWYDVVRPVPIIHVTFGVVFHRWVADGGEGLRRAIGCQVQHVKYVLCKKTGRNVDADSDHEIGSLSSARVLDDEQKVHDGPDVSFQQQ
jgi:hypothetical protein